MYNTFMKQAYKYSDVWLLPKECAVATRKQISTSVTLGGWTFKVPIVPANMLCTIDESLSNTLSDNGYFYIHHRFEDTLSFCIRKHENKKLISISVGVKQEDYNLLKSIAELDIVPDFITIDIAHGHTPRMKQMIEFIRMLFGYNTFIIAGNVCTKEGALTLQEYGADAIKVGIGQGGACTTKYKTGFTLPMFTCVLECAEVVNTPIIADGGVEHNGDIAKALVAGATMVMAGGMFARLYDSPAPLTLTGYKEYFGSASVRTKIHTQSAMNNIEGTTKTFEEVKSTYLEKLKEIEEDLQSAISYAGGLHCEDLLTVKFFHAKD